MRKTTKESVQPEKPTKVMAITERPKRNIQAPKRYGTYN